MKSVDFFLFINIPFEVDFKSNNPRVFVKDVLCLSILAIWHIKLLWKHYKQNILFIWYCLVENLAAAKYKAKTVLRQENVYMTT